MIEEIKQLLLAYGWVDLGPQKNQYMISFRHDEREDRMNVYYTTMTVTIQNDTGVIKTYRDVDINKLEEIIA